MEKYEQQLNGMTVMVVDFDEMPELPIRGNNYFARLKYKMITSAFGGAMLSDRKDKSDHYAEALTLAIKNGIITQPGKYAIKLSEDLWNYEIYTVTE